MDKQIIIWEVATAATNQQDIAPRQRHLHRLRYLGQPARRRGQNGEVYIWGKADALSWSEPKLVKTWKPHSNDAEELYVAFDPQGRSLVTTGRPHDRDGFAVHFWGTSGAWGELGSYRQSKPIRSLQFAPDSRRLAIGGDDGEIRLLDFTDSGQGTVTRLAAHQHAVTGLSAVFGSDQLMSCSTDGTVRSWALNRGTWSGGRTCWRRSKTSLRMDSSMRRSASIGVVAPAPVFSPTPVRTTSRRFQTTPTSAVRRCSGDSLGRKIGARRGSN